MDELRTQSKIILGYTSHPPISQSFKLIYIRPKIDDIFLNLPIPGENVMSPTFLDKMCCPPIFF